MRVFIKKRLTLTVTLVIFVFCVMVATLLLIIGSLILLQHFGVISPSHPTSENTGSNAESPLSLLLIFFLLCIFIGPALTAFFSRIALNPIRKVIVAIHRVANGDFNTKINIKGIGELEELSHSFNKMTQELSGIETLRSDFINNFSHEFKTPIVSLRGFAKLLKENKLTQEERQEYLDIIITESERLAELSTNVLTLAKYENLEIIVDKTPFRLDEQLRKTIILLEPKWSAKDITVNVKLDEVIYTGKEELTQQIWLNLLDNAIKFSNQGGLITITLENINGVIQFVIQDEGAGMDNQTRAHIFDKFYQGDTSHLKSGYGLGLPLVKRIVNLCGGNISVQSESGKGSIFTIELPC
ncbi:HAMP domain-containing sensor histidine kinase [Metabacillus fastidiosus]|uniref:HAMP domain-containing sensor histidine kinase n=1 Tax=Metabacillus fastidiosus TaxID=1458 RepID=UPI003D2B92A6